MEITYNRVQNYGSKGLAQNSAHVLVFAPEKCQYVAHGANVQ
jgi:hypothetical protein